MIVELDRYRFAQRLFEERRYTAAARELEGVLDAARRDPGPAPHGLDEAELLLARAYYHSAQLGRAEQAARALLERDPADGYAALLLGRTLQRAARPEEARRLLARAAALGVTA